MYNSRPKTDGTTAHYAPTTGGDWSPSPATVGAALDQLAARPTGSGGGGVTHVFVYRDGEPSPAGNVYATFNAAYQARHAVKGRAILEIDATLGFPSIAPGAYDLHDTVLSGKVGNQDLLIIGDGVSFVGLSEIRNLNLSYSGTAPLMTVGSTHNLTVVDSMLRTGTDAPMFRVQDGSAFLLDVRESILQGRGMSDAYLIESVDSSQVVIFVSGFYRFPGSSESQVAVLDSLLVNDSTGSTLVVRDSTANTNNPPSIGTWSEILRSESGKVAFTPSVTDNWPVMPITVEGALNLLGARGAPPSHLLIFRPGGSAGGDVYTDEVSLGTASQLLGGEPYTVFFDGSLVDFDYEFTTIGSLNWAPNATWTDGGHEFELEFTNNTTFTNTPAEITGALYLRFNQSDTAFPNPVIDGCSLVVSGRVELRCSNTASTAISLSGPLLLKDAAFIRGSDNNQAYVFENVEAHVYDSVRLQEGFKPNSFEIEVSSPGAYVSGSLYLSTVIRGLFFDQDVAGIGNLNANGSTGALVSSGGVVYLSKNGSWVSIGGTPTASDIVYEPDSPGDWNAAPSQVAQALDKLAHGFYSPATPGNWNPAPTQVIPALDQLAAKVSTLGPQFTGVQTATTYPAEGSTVKVDLVESVFRNPIGMDRDSLGRLWVGNQTTIGPAIRILNSLTAAEVGTLDIQPNSPYGSPVSVRSIIIRMVNGVETALVFLPMAYGVILIDVNTRLVIGSCQVPFDDINAQPLNGDLDSAGNLWVNASYGANETSNSTFFVFDHTTLGTIFNQNPTTVAVQSMHVQNLMSDGTYLWGGSGPGSDNKLYRFDPTQPSQPPVEYQHTDRLHTAHVAFGSIWSGGTTGIYRFDPNTFPSAPIATCAALNAPSAFTTMTHDFYFLYVCNAENNPSVTRVYNGNNSNFSTGGQGVYANISEATAPTLDGNGGIWICNIAGETDSQGSIVNFDSGGFFTRSYRGLLIFKYTTPYIAPIQSYLNVYGGQSTNLANDDHIVFSSVAYTQGDAITLDTSSPYSSGPGASIGRIGLKGGLKYRLTANPNFIDGGNVLYQWFDVDSGQPLGQAARYDGSFGMAANVVAFYAPVSDSMVEVRFRFITGVTQLGANNPLNAWATVETLP